MKNYLNKKNTIIGLFVVVIAIGGFYTYDRFLSKDSPSTMLPDNAAVTTSSAPTAQNDFNDGTDREPGNSLSEGEGDGTIEDTRGRTPNPASSSGTNATTSDSGQITIYSPSKSQTLRNGDQLVGKSELSKVHFRLIDNVSGVISKGTLKVVDGKFSGIFHFSTTASEGRLDIFGAKNNGVEISNIEIPIKF